MTYDVAARVEQLWMVRCHTNDRWWEYQCRPCVEDALTAAYAAGVASMQPWKDAVIDATVVSWTYQKEHETDPRAAINAALAWESQVALDPAVSKGAQELYDKAHAAGVAEERARLLTEVDVLLTLQAERERDLAAVDALCRMRDEMAATLRDGPTS